MPEIRVYEEKEIIRIIERAIEHQHAGPNRNPGLGLTLEELEHLGAEVGISPEHLQRAAAEVDLVSEPWVQRVSGGLYEVHTERWLPGPLSEADIEGMFAEVRARHGAAMSAGSPWWGPRGDEVERLGRSLAVQLDINGATRIAVRPQAGGHVLRVSRSLVASKLSDSVILGTCLTTVLAILPVAAAVEWLNVWWAILAGVLTLLFSVTMTHQWTRRTRARAEQKAQEIAETAAQILLASGTPRSAATSEGAITSGEAGPEPVLQGWDDEEVQTAPPREPNRRPVR